MRIFLGFAIFLASCASQSSVNQIDPAIQAKARAAHKISVVYVTSAMLNIGTRVPEYTEPESWWGVIPTVKNALAKEFAANGRSLETFELMTVENNFISRPKPLPSDTEALLVISEGDMIDPSTKLRYKGVGILADSDKSRVIPYAIFDVAMTLQAGGPTMRAYNGPFAGKPAGTDDISVAGVAIRQPLAFSPDEKIRLRDALAERIRSVLHVLLNDLSLSKK